MTENYRLDLVNRTHNRNTIHKLPTMFTPGDTVLPFFSTSSKFLSTCPWKKHYCRRNQFPQKRSLRRTLNEWHLNKPRSRCVQVKCVATGVQGMLHMNMSRSEILNITIETNSSGVCSLTWAYTLAKSSCKNNLAHVKSVNQITPAMREYFTEDSSFVDRWYHEPQWLSHITHAKDISPSSLLVYW